MHTSQEVGAVQAVDGPGLVKAVQAAKTDSLVVFYAPWCGHCKGFVLSGPDGTMKTAPIEILKKELQSTNPTVDVLKFDTQANQVPAGFAVQYIPTIFLVAPSGQRVAYKGDPNNGAQLKQFALAGVPAGAALLEVKPHA